ncbi:hypothetical protein I4U23_005921 [Adineta vaga]|nr:hypothetical protein I4U23_005921 [Adineta vaga]
MKFNIICERKSIQTSILEQCWLKQVQQNQRSSSLSSFPIESLFRTESVSSIGTTKEFCTENEDKKKSLSKKVFTFYVKDRSSLTASIVTIMTSSSDSLSTSSISSTTSTTPEMITFDDLSSAIAVPTGYNNFNWTNGNTQTKAVNTSGYFTEIVRNPNSVMNPNANPLTMTIANSSLFTLYIHY